MANIATHRNTVLYQSDGATVPLWTTEDWPDYIMSPTKGETRKIIATSGGTIVLLNPYVAVSLFCVRNTSASISVDVAYVDGASHSNTQRIPPGGMMDISSISRVTPVVISGIAGSATCLLAIAGT